MYLEITYNDNQKETIKLRYTKDYNNDSLFSMKQEKIVEKVIVKEEIKVEEKPTVLELSEPAKQLELPKEEPPKEDPPKDQEITIDQVILKIKETCTLDMDSYICDFEGTFLLYYEEENRIIILQNDDILVDYQIDDNRYNCSTSDCENLFKNTTQTYLFQ